MKFFTAKKTETGNERATFPLLAAQDIAYLDSGATTQKPQAVLDALNTYYTTANANVHRGVYKLADASTQAYEDARETVAKYCGVSRERIVFTSGATHALNLAAHLLGGHLRAGDEILTTVAEHHALFVPFQQLAKRAGLKFIVVPLNHEKTITVEHVNEFITPKTKIIAISAMSNVLGYSLDTKKIKKGNAYLVVDAAQSIRHTPSYPAADLVAFSGHKLYGPQGIGVLVASEELLAKGEPLFTGGAMIQSVTIAKSTWTTGVARYEAGTPNVAGAVGLAAAIDYYAPLRKDAEKREQALTEQAVSIVSEYARVLGPDKRAGPIVSFVMERAHGHDVAQVLDSVGVCVRAGHHCCQPLHDALGVDASVRVSIALYNTPADLERLERGLQAVREVFP